MKRPGAPLWGARSFLRDPAAAFKGLETDFDCMSFGK